jgi:NitT/TauT family transport system substrate-binding protein
MGASELGIWVARKGFIEKNRAAMVDLLEDYLRAVRFYTDPSNHPEAVRIAASFSKLPPAVFDPWLFTKNDYYRDPDGRPNLAALQSNIDLERQEGFVKSPIDIKKYVDLSLVGEAAARLQ